MKPEEAIEIIKVAKAEVEWNYPLDYAVAFEEAIEALEKQIPKKPVYEDYYEVYCPFCGNEFYFQPKFCDACGQAILSHDVEEEWQVKEE